MIVSKKMTKIELKRKMIKIEANQTYQHSQREVQIMPDQNPEQFQANEEDNDHRQPFLFSYFEETSINQSNSLDLQTNQEIAEMNKILQQILSSLKAQDKNLHQRYLQQKAMQNARKKFIKEQEQALQKLIQEQKQALQKFKKEQKQALQKFQKGQEQTRQKLMWQQSKNINQLQKRINFEIAKELYDTHKFSSNPNIVLPVFEFKKQY